MKYTFSSDISSEVTLKEILEVALRFNSKITNYVEKGPGGGNHAVTFKSKSQSDFDSLKSYIKFGN